MKLRGFTGIVESNFELAATLIPDRTIVHRNVDTVKGLGLSFGSLMFNCIDFGLSGTLDLYARFFEHEKPSVELKKKYCKVQGTK